MNACRDLMELTALIHDFRMEPQRLAKWLKASEDQRARDFGFSKLLYKYEGRDSAFAGPLDDLMAEYIAHCQTLHPSPIDGNPNDLSRGVETKWDPISWVAYAGDEVARHATPALSEMLMLLDDAHSSQMPADFDWSHEAIDAWRDRVQHYTTAMGLGPGAEEAKQRHMPKRRARERAQPGSPQAPGTDVGPASDENAPRN